MTSSPTPTDSPMAALGEDRSSLRRELLRLAWPVLLQNLARTGLFLADTAMLGRVGEHALASIGVAWPIAHTVYHFLMALSVGALAMTARAWGEGNKGKQEQAGATAMTLALVIGVPLSLAGYYFLPMAASLFPVPGAPEVTGMARSTSNHSRPTETSGMPSRDELTQAIVGAIKGCLSDKGIEGAEVQLDTRVDTTLGLDSLDWAAVVVELEEGLGVDPFAEGVDRELKTVQDLVDVYEAAF